MADADRTFHSEVDSILEEFERRRARASDDLQRRKDDWKAAVHDFRDLARRAIVPTLREVREPLRNRGLRPYISDNTRQGLDVRLEVDAEQLKPICLTFRLDAEARSVEIDGLTQNGAPQSLAVPIAAFGRPVVERAVVSFLRQLP